MDEVKRGTVVSKRTTLVNIVLPVVQLWVCRKGKVVDLSSRLEAERVVSEISPLEFGDVPQFDSGAFIVRGLVELMLSIERSLKK